ncbi:hypothetical protein BD626DRAFT_460874 [Schizophyllum amplum]|uniref:Uncharacterized protein n=1 Tax=Schizophyllum amplum TaxID=97359 RepID=A0A550C6V2_9AGAR|nr:hypothetical protein BD626DRAFT_460874 [Auriculariopsis ampla]
MPPALSGRVNSELDKIQALLRAGSRAQRAEHEQLQDWSATEQRRQLAEERRWEDLSRRLDAVFEKINANKAGPGHGLDTFTTKDILIVMKEQHEKKLDELMVWARTMQDTQQQHRDELLSILSLASTPVSTNASLT